MTESHSTHSGLAVVERSGIDPAIVMMHGFPDDSRIYARLSPLLHPHRTIAFDWLGYGGSDRRDPADLDHQRQLLAVLDAVDVRSAVLVGHDASGPEAIDFTLDHPDRVAHLVLLNTYYGHAPALRFPEMIQLLADHDLTALADAMLDDANQRLWLLQLAGRLFGDDPNSPDSVGVQSVLPQFFGEAGRADALLAIRAWTGALFASLDEQDVRAERLAALDTPVSLIFGARDPYLSPGVARHLASRFPNAGTHLVSTASHWPQWDDPAATATLITESL